MRKATVEPQRFFLHAPKPILAPLLPGDVEEHWLEVNARPRDVPPRKPDESGGRWWE